MSKKVKYRIIKNRRKKRFSKSTLCTVLSMLILTATLYGCNQNSLSPTIESTPDNDMVMKALEEEIKLKDDLLDKLLSRYTFYKGKVFIDDDSLIKQSSERDKLNGSGSHQYESEEVVIYDPLTEMVYIVARSMYYTGQDQFTYTDLITGFSKNERLEYYGENHEYYGTGILMKKEIKEGAAIASNTLSVEDFELRLHKNPVRMRPKDKVILTDPPSRKVYWVTLSSASSDPSQISGVTNQPEEAPYEVLNLMPNLPEVVLNISYNRSLTQMAQLTNGLYGFPSGNFICEYEKISYEEAMELAQEIREAKEMQEVYEKLAELQPKAWKETAKMGDGIRAAADASSAIQSHFDQIGLESAVNSNDRNTVLTTADAISSDPEIRKQMDHLDIMPSSGQEPVQPASGGTPRSLEGVVIESSSEGGGGPQQKQLSATFAGTKPQLEQLFKSFSDASKDLKQQLLELQTLRPFTTRTEVSKVKALLKSMHETQIKLITTTETAKKYLNPLQAILYDLSIKEDASMEARYQQLNLLFQSWPGGQTESAAQVDLNTGVLLPEGYPVSLVPLPKAALLMMAEEVSDPDGGEIGYMLTLKCEETQQALIAYYRAALKNYKDLEVIEAGGMTIFSAFEKGTEISVMVMANSLGGTEPSMVQISVMPE